MMAGVTWLVVAAVCVTQALGVEGVEVTVGGGVLRGATSRVDNRTVINTFFAVPYAQPPLGELRFKAPQRASAWKGMRDATRFSSMCPQTADSWTRGLPQSEDCLYLNIYSPQISGNTDLLPVMVWIHGGSYRKGAGSLYNGTELAARGVVVVTVNYRLDALGFLSTLDGACPGNNGLLDQVAALAWVRDNARAVGGDPARVTIVGESAGASSVSLLRLSPLAKGLFQRAIMQSGVALAPWAVARPEKDGATPAQAAAALAHALACPQSSPALVQCLRNASVDAIIAAAGEIYKAAGAPVFRPTVDKVGGSLPETPLRMLIEGAGGDVASIRGVNKDEFAFFLKRVPESNYSLGYLQAGLAAFSDAYFPGHGPAVAARVMAEYVTSRHVTTPAQIRAAIVQIRTDFDFVVPTVLESQHSVARPRHAPQFFYRFSYRPPHATIPQWEGVPHTAELPFVLGAPLAPDAFEDKAFPYQWTPTDRQVATDVITLWTNFAKYGSPTPRPVSGASWPAYGLQDQGFLEVNTSGQIDVTHTQPGQRALRFWVDILDSLGGLVG